MKIEIDKDTAELLIDAISTSHLPTKRSLMKFLKTLKTIYENEEF